MSKKLTKSLVAHKGMDQSKVSPQGLRLGVMDTPEDQEAFQDMHERRLIVGMGINRVEAEVLTKYWLSHIAEDSHFYHEFASGIGPSHAVRNYAIGRVERLIAAGLLTKGECDALWKEVAPNVARYANATFAGPTEDDGSADRAARRNWRGESVA